MNVLGDQDIDTRVSMSAAIEAVERVLAEKARGTMFTPPRHYAPMGDNMLVFTIGGNSGGAVVGFRVYGVGGVANGNEQIVVVYDGGSGELRGIVKGARLGALRTGALGGVALKYAARGDAATLALIGSGTQASTQLEAAAVARDLKDVRVYSRSAEKREAFADKMSDKLSIAISAVKTPQEAIAGADIVIVATSSPKPVFDASLIEPGQHVTTIRLGIGQHELDPAVADRAGAIFTDSMEQLTHYPGGFFLPDHLDQVTDLSTHVDAGRPVRSSAEEITLYLSTGLSGTEVAVADIALRA